MENSVSNYDSNLNLCRQAYYYWTAERNYILAEQYYYMAISNGSLFALSQIAQFYYETGRFEKAVEYISKAIESGDKGCIEALLSYHINEGKKLDKKSLELVIPHAEELFKDEKVALYIIHNCILHKVEIFIYGIKIYQLDEQINEQKECTLCLENKNIFVSPSCGHDICGNCFIDTIEKNNTLCSYCRKQYTVGCINLVNINDIINMMNNMNNTSNNGGKQQGKQI